MFVAFRNKANKSMLTRRECRQCGTTLKLFRKENICKRCHTAKYGKADVIRMQSAFGSTYQEEL